MCSFGQLITCNLAFPLMQECRDIQCVVMTCHPRVPFDRFDQIPATLPAYLRTYIQITAITPTEREAMWIFYGHYCVYVRDAYCAFF